MEIIRKIIENNLHFLKGCRFIIHQHLLSDTLDLVLCLLEKGIEIDALIAKEYSVNMSVYNEIKDKVPTSIMWKDDNRICYKALKTALDLSLVDQKKIVILDLGGEFAETLDHVDTQRCPIVVVEDTLFGHRIYEKMAIDIDNISVYSVARSHVKEIEAKFVGKAIAYTSESVFRSIGKTLFGENVLVIGYGMIGKNTAKSLNDFGCKISVYDIDPMKLCRAHFDGFNIGSIHHLLDQNYIVIGTTGKTSLSRKDLITSKSEFHYLISGSSKQIEFSRDIFSETKPTVLNNYIKKYELERRIVYEVNDGFPVNFLSQSIPDSITELLFAEMLYCITESFDKSSHFNRGVIGGASKENLGKIAMLFLHERCSERV